MMTTGSDPAADLQDSPSDAASDSPPASSRVRLALSLVVIATLLAAIFYWFKREEVPPISDGLQTEP